MIGYVIPEVEIYYLASELKKTDIEIMKDFAIYCTACNALPSYELWREYYEESLHQGEN